MTTSWIVLQLADSAFPTGGFAHSAGLEAHVQSGEVTSAGDVARFVDQLVDQLTHGSLPMVAAVHDDPSRLGEVDAFARATTWSHVVVRASRAQGRALLDVAARGFGHPELVAARKQTLIPPPEGIDGHLAPAYGFVTRVLGVDRDEAMATFLHLGARGALSAAVRLGVVGPTEAQSIHLQLHDTLERGLSVGRSLIGLPLEEAISQPAPILELIQGTHDRLYSRLFQS